MGVTAHTEFLACSELVSYQLRVYIALHQETSIVGVGNARRIERDRIGWDTRHPFLLRLMVVLRRIGHILRCCSLCTLFLHASARRYCTMELLSVRYYLGGYMYMYSESSVLTSYEIQVSSVASSLKLPYRPYIAVGKLA